MKPSLLFVLIYTTIVKAVVFCDRAEVNTARADLTSNCDLREDEKEDKVLLSRKRRFLTFPEGSAIATTLSVVKPLVFRATVPYNVIIEYDVIWPVPGDEEDEEDEEEEEAAAGADSRISFDRIGRPTRWRLHRRHRREFYSVHEAALDSQGLPGKQCILRTICEAQSVLSPPGVSLVEDLLKIIFGNTMKSKNEVDEYDLAHESKNNCDLKYACPFSMIELLLSYDHNFET